MTLVVGNSYTGEELFEHLSETDDIVILENGGAIQILTK